MSSARGLDGPGPGANGAAWWPCTPAARETMAPEGPQRPAWLNWLFLAIFLWSSWQLAGLWFQRLGG